MEPATRRQGYGATDSDRARSEMATPPVPIPEARGDADVTRYLPVAIILLMLIIDGLGFTVALAPQTRLFEDIVCRRHYSRIADDTLGLRSGPLEDSCKIPAVQDFVAQLFGWQTFFDGIPGLVLAIYFGVQADTRGRRAVLFWSMAGQLLGMAWVLMICWLGLPLQLTWLSSLFLVIGGGSTVTSAVSMMVLTDSTSEDARSRVFFLAQAVLVVAEIIGPALSSATMKTSLWLPLSIALACTMTTTVLAAVIPETMRPSRGTEPLDPDSARKPGRGGRGFKGRLSIIWRHTSSTINFIISHSNILYLVVTFLVVDYSRQSLGILLQYTSLRYSISISRANLLFSFKAFAQLATFALILPAVDAFIIKHLRVSAKSKDLWLSRLSIGFLATGFAILAPSLPFVVVALVIYTLGSGFNAFARSLLSSLVEPHMIGTLFTTLAIMDTTGSLLAGPMVAGTFSWSLKLTGIARGLPYMFSFVICSLAMLALARVGVANSTLDPTTTTSMEDEECRPMMDGEPEEGVPKLSTEADGPSTGCS